MALHAAARYETARDMATELEKWMAREAVGAYSEAIRERIARLYQRDPATIVVVIVAGLISLEVIAKSAVYSSGVQKVALN